MGHRFFLLSSRHPFDGLAQWTVRRHWYIAWVFLHCSVPITDRRRSSTWRGLSASLRTRTTSNQTRPPAFVCSVADQPRAAVYGICARTGHELGQPTAAGGDARLRLTPTKCLQLLAGAHGRAAAQTNMCPDSAGQRIQLIACRSSRSTATGRRRRAPSRPPICRR